MRNILLQFVNIGFSSVILVTGLFSLSGCEEPEYVALSKAFKAYTDFPEGSWWVYENVSKSGNNVRDSVYLNRRVMSVSTERGSNDEYEIIDYGFPSV